MKRYFTLLCLLFVYRATVAQNAKQLQLEEDVRALNNTFQYEKAVTLIDSFINNETDPYNRYYAYKIKAFTYKRFFNYPQVIFYLDKALAEGLQSDKKDSVTAAVKAEKAFAYFDIHRRDSAMFYMNDLKDAGYTYVADDDRAFILLQYATYAMETNNYTEAEKYINDAEPLLAKAAPRNLPMLYGKKIYLYSLLKQPEKREEAFSKGLAAAEEYGIVKYKMSLFEAMAQTSYNLGQYKESCSYRDSLINYDKAYNALDHNARLAVYEKEAQNQKAALAAQYNHRLIVILCFTCLLLLAFLILLHQYYRLAKRKNNDLQLENKNIHDELQALMEQATEAETIECSKNYHLTDRQAEILELLRQGKSNKEIAAALFISENTVKYHLKLLYEKLNVANRDDLKNIPA